MTQNLEDAHDVDDAIVCLLLKRGASSGVVKIVEGIAAEAVELYGTRIRNPGEVSLDTEALAKAVLRANLEALNKQPLWLWLLRIVCFKGAAFREFKRIVEGL